MLTMTMIVERWNIRVESTQSQYELTTSLSNAMSSTGNVCQRKGMRTSIQLKELSKVLVRLYHHLNYQVTV